MSTQVTPLVEVHRQLPIPNVEGQQGAVRGSRYNEIMVQNVVPSKQILADEGSYFVATNPTPGTAITSSTAVAGSTSYLNTMAFAVLKNNDNAGNPKAKRVYLDYMRLLLVGTAPTATTDMHFSIHLDNVTRTPTAQSTGLITPVNVNMDDATTPITQLWVANANNNLTVPAPSGSNRIVSRCSFQTSLGMSGDEYVLQFGPQDLHGATGGLTAVRATATAKLTACGPPVVIGPQQWCVVYMWWRTHSGAPAWEFEYAWWER